MPKQMFLRVATVAAVFALSGCKIELGALIPISGLLGQEVKTSTAELYLEVPSCDSYEDSRQPSQSLIDAKNQISSLFIGSEFKECFKKKFDSFASFTVPVAYGPDGKVKDSSAQLRVLYNEKKFAYFEASSDLKEKLEQIKNKPSIAGGFNPSDVSIFITLVNDTGHDIKSGYAGVYLGNTPVIQGNGIGIPNGKQVTLKLSDVTTSVIFEKTQNNYAWFMTDIQ
ncbi:DUF7424 family protein [Kluyvera sichuanensis]|uniref:DUF7424 family protein n=1 Tax=Kluyvera sichuanensis TaxID=2725494 RepID=UPI00397AA8B5